MPLSEHEQRLLEQMERALYAEDPKFVSSLRGTDLRSHYRRRALASAVGFILGVVLLMTGVVSTIWIVGVFGFVLMLASALFAVTSWRKVSGTGEDFSGVHAYLDEVIPEASERLLGKARPALIGGRDRDQGPVVAAKSPIDREIVLGEFPQGDATLVDEAVEAARRAYPDWRDLGWQRRVAILRVIEKRANLVSDSKQAVDVINQYVDEMISWRRQMAPLDRAVSGRRSRRAWSARRSDLPPRSAQGG